MSESSEQGDWDAPGRASGSRWVVAVVAVVVAAALLAGGGSAVSRVADADADGAIAVERRSELLDLAPGSEDPARDGGGRYRCIAPFALAAYSLDDGRRAAYVAGHPDAPSPGVRPDSCFDRVSAAEVAGYREVPLPASDVVVDGVVLTNAGDRYLPDCQASAAELGHVVPCPRWLPRDLAGDLPRCSRQVPGGDSRCVIDLPERIGGARGFAVATIAAGLPPAGSATATRPGLLVIAASSEPHSAFIACTPEELAEDGPLPLVGLTDCPSVDRQSLDQSLPHAGRRTTRYLMDDIWVAVSLGTRGRPLDAARQLVIRGLYPVLPESAPPSG